MKRWTLRLLILLGLVAGGVALKKTVLKPEPVVVEVYDLVRGPVESTVTNTRAGTVTARRRAQLTTQIGGLVLELPHAEGDRVEAGDLLLRLDQRVQAAQREVAQRRLESAEARREEALLLSQRSQRELDRYRRLSADKLISEDVFDQLTSARDRARVGVRTAEAQLAEARAALALVEAQMAQGELRAPFGGVIAERSVELGEYVTPSPPGLPIPAVIDLIDPSSIYIKAPMDEVDSTLIQVGMTAKVTIDSYPDQVFAGVVGRIAPFVLDLKEQNRTIDIEVELDDCELARKLLPGTSADVEVVLQVETDVLRIPTSSILEGGRVLVFEDSKLVERKVQIGLRNWNWTSIRSGLEPGDRVVTSLGSAAVHAGAEARLAE